MSYTIALQVPQTPIREEWAWTTDLMTSYDGEEDRIPLTRYPKRTFSGQYSFDSVADVRRHMAFMFTRFGTIFQLPLYQHQVKLKAAAAATDTSVSVNATRSDFRAGRDAFIIEGERFETLTVDTVSATEVTFTTPLVNSYSKRAIICPLTVAYTASGSGFGRLNPDSGASASYRYMEREPWTPFLSPLNEVELTMFEGSVVLDNNAVGNRFDSALNTGIIISNYIGLSDLFTPWNQSQWTFPLSWQSNRVLDLESWLWWYAFADHVQGSMTPFLVPTHREDLTIVTPANGSGTTVTVEGTEYSEHYWGLDTFKRIVIDSSVGRHYARITGITEVAGNDRLTFTPALPAGAGWNVDQRIEYLLKVRIADDKIICDHHGLHTEVSMSLRTVT